MGSDHHRHAWCGAPRPDSDDVSGGQVILPVLSMAIYLWFQCLKVPYIVWFFDFVIIHQHGDFSYLIEGFTTQNDPKCRFDVFKGWCKKNRWRLNLTFPVDKCCLFSCPQNHNFWGEQILNMYALWVLTSYWQALLPKSEDHCEVRLPSNAFGICIASPHSPKGSKRYVQKLLAICG